MPLHVLVRAVTVQEKAFVLSAGALKKQRVKNKITERFIQIDCPAL